MNKKILFFLLNILLGLIFLSPVYSQTPDGKSIMSNVYEPSGRETTSLSISNLATCPFVIKKKKLKCRKKPRMIRFKTVQKNLGKRGGDSKILTVLLSPPSEYGISLLSYSYEDDEKENERWIFLPAFGKVRRIASGSKDVDEPDTGNLFGSVFTFEDFENKHVADYTFELLREETYRKRPAYVVREIPTPKRARVSNYSKMDFWVDKERNVILRTLIYNRQGNFFKEMLFHKITEVQGRWVAIKAIAKNLETQRISVRTVEKLIYEKPVEDKLVSQRALTDKVYRERTLAELEKYLDESELK